MAFTNKKRFGRSNHRNWLKDKGSHLKTFLREFVTVLTILLTIILAVLGWISLNYYFSLDVTTDVTNQTIIEPPDSFETITESHHEYNDDSVGELE